MYDLKIAFKNIISTILAFTITINTFSVMAITYENPEMSIKNEYKNDISVILPEQLPQINDEGISLQPNLQTYSVGYAARASRTISQTIKPKGGQRYDIPEGGELLCDADNQRRSAEDRHGGGEERGTRFFFSGGSIEPGASQHV